MGPAQQSVCEQVHRRRLRQGDVHRRLTQRTVSRLRVRPGHIVPPDWLKVCQSNEMMSNRLCSSSQSGVVNIYSQEACLHSANPKPLKAVMNLLTSATSLTFNPSSEILAIASRAEDEAVRLVRRWRRRRRC